MHHERQRRLMVAQGGRRTAQTSIEWKPIDLSGATLHDVGGVIAPGWSYNGKTGVLTFVALQAASAKVGYRNAGALLVPITDTDWKVDGTRGLRWRLRNVTGMAPSSSGLVLWAGVKCQGETQAFWQGVAGGVTETSGNLRVMPVQMGSLGTVGALNNAIDGSIGRCAPEHDGTGLQPATGSVRGLVGAGRTAASALTNTAYLISGQEAFFIGVCWSAGGAETREISCIPEYAVERLAA